VARGEGFGRLWRGRYPDTVELRRSPVDHAVEESGRVLIIGVLRHVDQSAHRLVVGVVDATRAKLFATRGHGLAVLAEGFGPSVHKGGSFVSHLHVAGGFVHARHAAEPLSKDTGGVVLRP